jgi:hypothetical protein
MHFQAIAEAIHAIQDSAARESAARALVVACKQFNPRFDINRFLKCCGVAA